VKNSYISKYIAVSLLSLCNNKTISLNTTLYYSNQEATCFGCKRQPSSQFAFIVMKYINTVRMTNIRFV